MGDLHPQRIHLPLRRRVRHLLHRRVRRRHLVRGDRRLSKLPPTQLPNRPFEITYIFPYCFALGSACFLAFLLFLGFSASFDSETLISGFKTWCDPLRTIETSSTLGCISP